MPSHMPSRNAEPDSKSGNGYKQQKPYKGHGGDTQAGRRSRADIDRSGTIGNRQPRELIRAEYEAMERKRKLWSS